MNKTGAEINLSAGLFYLYIILNNIHNEIAFLTFLKQ